MPASQPPWGGEEAPGGWLLGSGHHRCSLSLPSGYWEQKKGERIRGETTAWLLGMRNTSVLMTWSTNLHFEYSLISPRRNLTLNWEAHEHFAASYSLFRAHRPNPNEIRLRCPNFTPFSFPTKTLQHHQGWHTPPQKGTAWKLHLC